MSSALLYVAIVAVWGIVLVPMWLRRDGSRLLNRRTDVADDTEILADPPAEDESLFEDDETTSAAAETAEHAEDAEDGPAVPGTPPVAPASYARPRTASRPRARSGRRRAAVIARRRRRTLGLTLLLLTSAGVVAGGLTPWWFVLPAVAAITGHLALLRVAVRIDAEQRRTEAARRARHAARQRALEAERHAREEEERLARAREAAQRTAEIIEMPDRPYEEVYDQYTDQRAVGD